MAAFVPAYTRRSIFVKNGPVSSAMGSYIVPETIKIRFGGGLDDNCNGHYGNFEAFFLLSGGR